MAEELSFEELGKAFARAMHGESPTSPDPAPEVAKPDGTELVDIPEDFLNEEYTPLDSEETNTLLDVYNESEKPVFEFPSDDPFASEIDDDKIVPVSPKTVLESMLFVGNPRNKPLPPGIASDFMRGVTVDEIHALVRDLNETYRELAMPWEIVFVEDGYLMQLREEHAPLRELFYGKIRQAKLSQAAIDVLAIVAYEQPLTLDEISQLRGVPCANILSQLVKRQLLRVQKVRRGTKFMSVYYTTERFLKLFELESLGDLPQSEDLSTK